MLDIKKIKENPQAVKDDAAFAAVLSPLLQADMDSMVDKLGNKKLASVILKRQVPRDVVAGMLLPIFLPFNLTKAMMNAGLVLVLYKPVSVALKKARVLKGGPDHFAFDKKTLAVLIGGIALIALCVVIFLVGLHGNF